MELLSYPIPNDTSKTLILESIGENAFEKEVFVVDFGMSNMVNVGRQSAADVRLSDITVSRVQSFISRNAVTGEIHIHDNCSKFGTLALIQRPMKLKLTTNKIQLGRNLVEIDLKKRTKRCLCWDVDMKMKFDPKET